MSPMTTKDYVLTVRISTELRDKLQEMADADDRTMSSMVQRILSEAVRKHMKGRKS